MTRKSPWVLMTLFLVQLAWMMGVVAAAGAAEPSMKFTAEPGPGSSATSDGYYVVESQQGDKVTKSIRVVNISEGDIEVRLAGVGANTGLKGGVDYGLPEDDLTIGSWIDLSSERVGLEAGESRLIPFTISVPDDAPTGTSLAGIAVWVPADKTVAPKKGNAFLSMQTRRVIAVQVNLSGAGQPGIAVNRVGAVALPDGPYLEMLFKNSGTSLTSGSGYISVDGMGFEQDFTFGTFVPGTIMRFPIKLDQMPADGTYAASIHLDFDGGKTDWSGEVVIGDELTAALVDRGAIEQPFRFPVLPVIVGVVASAGVAAVLIRRRRGAAVPAGVPARVSIQMTREASRAPASSPLPDQSSYKGSPPPPPPPPVVNPSRLAPPPPPPIEAPVMVGS